MTILCALLDLVVAILVTTITSLYDLTILLFICVCVCVCVCVCMCECACMYVQVCLRGECSGHFIFFLHKQISLL